MSYIEKIVTDDGTISFYNKEIGDIYHSRIGAYKEALEKFVLPSGILEKLHNYNVINVFDVCFGPGYNTKVLLSELLNHAPEIKVNVVSVEIDPNIILNSTEVCFNGYPYDLKDFFDSFLHKVYYTTISGRYDWEIPFEAQFKNISFKLFIADARRVVNILNDKYDLIFHDPFSPVKLPELWTVDILKQLYRLLDDKGVLLTYSSSNSVRGGMIEVGFKLGNTEPVGRKSPGTIVAKNEMLIQYPLTKEQKLLLDSTAGIPYYDPEFNMTSQEILAHRHQLQKISTRISASKMRNKLSQ